MATATRSDLRAVSLSVSKKSEQEIVATHKTNNIFVMSDVYFEYLRTAAQVRGEQLLRGQRKGVVENEGRLLPQ